MRKRKVLEPKAINKINFLWYVNQRTMTDICRIIGSSTPVVDRNLFPSRADWEKWEAEQIAKGSL